MPLFLLTLLGIAISITIAGFFLSSKIQVRNQQTAYYTGRIGRRSTEPGGVRVRRVATSGELAVRTRSSIPLRARAMASSSTVVVGAVHVPRQTGGKPIPLTVITAGLVSIFILFLYFLGMLLPHQVLLGYFPFYSMPAASPTASDPPVLYGASLQLVRIGQLNPAQYNSKNEYNTWAMSACSAAAMTEVINAYGHQYRVTDILKVESQLHEITPELGLLEDVGVARTVAKFGFKTDWGHSLSLDHVIAAANSGTPVIVSFPPDKYPGGHLLVVTGGNSTNVYLADSSIYNRHSLTRQQFMKWWEGFYAVVTPK